MNITIKKLIILFAIILFAIFLLNIFIKEIKTTKSDITKINIINYIPSNYELTILSNSTNNNIKNYINENISEDKRDELNNIKNSIISYLGFNLQDQIKDIYDNEFALTFYKNKLNKNDILLIFKLKKNKNINDIINISEELNKSDQIIELKRIGKLNYLSHIFLTKDNYIMASSNRKLIDSALQSNNDRSKIFSKTLMPKDINLKEIKLLSISNYNNSKNNLNSESISGTKLITIINSEDNKIKLRTFSPSINKISNKIPNNQIDNIKDIIFTNKYSPYKESISFLYNKINQSIFIEEISKKLDEKLLFITNNNNWVLCFQSQSLKNFSINQLNSIKKYKKEDFYINNINYSIYTNNRLKIKDNNIIYESKDPFFSLKDEANTYISNSFNDLLNITEENNLSDQYLNNNNEIKSYNYILNDIVFVKNINNEQLFKYYKFLKNLQFFIDSKLFSLEDINLNISHTIPELHEKVYLESNLKIL